MFKKQNNTVRQKVVTDLNRKTTGTRRESVRCLWVGGEACQDTEAASDCPLSHPRTLKVTRLFQISEAELLSSS